jgi:hypothetical protein
MKNIKITLLFCFFSVNLFSQTEKIVENQDKINSLFDKIISAKNDTVSLICNDSIKFILDDILQQENSFFVDFENVMHLGKITSSDRQVNIFTWNIPLKDKTLFNGFIQLADGTVFVLENEAPFKPLENNQYSATNWYGALYYGIVPFKNVEKNICYTLIGWSIYKPDTNVKIIDILSFDEKNIPVLGLPQFEVKDEDGNKKDFLKSRIVFEYDSQTTMYLEYNTKKQRFEFDHLSPMKVIDGKIISYAADLSIDGYKFKKNKWLYLDDLKVRNRRHY